MAGNRYAVALLCALAAGSAALADAAEPASVEVVAVRRGALPAAPDDPAWAGAPVYSAELLLQDLVEPRLLAASTDRVQVRAVTDGQRVAFRLDWTDATADDLPGVARYSDACAVQVPVRAAPNVPDPQMGDPQGPVEITYWRAFWQAAADGRADSIRSLYPGASVDHYPFEAVSLEPGSAAQREMEKRYAPARALGNAMAGPRDRPVEGLIAHGPGTLAAAPNDRSDGRGVRTAGGWRVVLSRPLPARVEPGARTQVAFAVWQGSNQESGARKMRTPWVPLLIAGER